MPLDRPRRLNQVAAPPTIATAATMGSSTSAPEPGVVTVPGVGAAVGPVVAAAVVGAAVEFALVGLAVVEPVVGFALGLAVAFTTVNVHVVRSMSPSAADLVVDWTV